MEYEMGIGMKGDIHRDPGTKRFIGLDFYSQFEGKKV